MNRIAPGWISANAGAPPSTNVQTGHLCRQHPACAIGFAVFQIPGVDRPVEGTDHRAVFQQTGSNARRRPRFSCREFSRPVPSPGRSHSRTTLPSAVAQPGAVGVERHPERARGASDLFAGVGVPDRHGVRVGDRDPVPASGGPVRAITGSVPDRPVRRCSVRSRRVPDPNLTGVVARNDAAVRQEPGLADPPPLLRHFEDRGLSALRSESRYRHSHPRNCSGHWSSSAHACGSWLAAYRRPAEATRSR